MSGSVNYVQILADFSRRETLNGDAHHVLEGGELEVLPEKEGES